MNYLLQLRRIGRTLIGKDFFATIDRDYPKQRLGSDYGGWDVMVDRIRPDSIIYSVGVGQDISFDLEMMNRFGVTIHAFDPTPKSIEWVRQQKLTQPFIMHEYGLADFDGTVSFNPPENAQHVSHTLLDRPTTQTNAITVSVKCLETIMRELKHDRIDLLKMDIEGAEYQVIDSLARSQIRPEQLLIEFHHRFPNVGCEKTKQAIRTLQSLRYSLFAASRTGEEFSFVYEGAIC
ncbi:MULTISPECIES: FkbM family methyltransferase [Leptolyngbya]|nr:MULTISPECIES: FkbM family methyltransferase [Leptolyngbya]MBD2369725.1 FkbM family methyltransferase [Leptolyngbya sp. FACHB-161]MBD2376074.1 FkbM family methyltransferase [Leptolyngbya sp. FACHB-238]MBD2400350.1 FkbM family methyltransferase [Leptolyngbya sp. FACHB-239]MBD2406891.1 FkbM family methyltransferase [Leptolyngbya sp. FACHB-402]ULP31013.1 FkbM family methyltransferase [Leptolyngbya boryana IU 594]